MQRPAGPRNDGPNYPSNTRMFRPRNPGTRNIQQASRPAVPFEHKTQFLRVFSFSFQISVGAAATRPEFLGVVNFIDVDE